MKYNNVNDSKLPLIAVIIPGKLSLVQGERGEVEVCSINRFGNNELPQELQTYLGMHKLPPFRLGPWWAYADGSGLSYAALELMAGIFKGA
jgi:hypothetical protein